MAYEKQTWKNGEDGNTPLTADRLNHIEDGIAEKAKQGEKGDDGKQGPAGKDGSDGSKGKAFTYDDFTEEQLDDLKGPKGDTGSAGKDGSDGSNGSNGVGVDDIKRSGNTLVFTMTDDSEIEVDLPSDDSGDGE